MPDNKAVKIGLDGATLTGFAAGIGYLAKKAFKKSFTADPSNSIENYVMFTGVMIASIWLKGYLEDQKSYPTAPNYLKISFIIYKNGNYRFWREKISCLE